MTNKIIIDGWNVCWKIPRIASLIPDDLEKARNEFNILVNIFFQNKKIKLKIIYDGQPGMIGQKQKKSGPAEIHFSKNPEKADHMIVKFLQKQKNARQWTVITSDRQLSDRVKGLNANIVSSEIFIKKLSKPYDNTDSISMKINPKMDQKEMDYWLDIFNE